MTGDLRQEMVGTMIHDRQDVFRRKAAERYDHDGRRAMVTVGDGRRTISAMQWCTRSGSESSERL